MKTVSTLCASGAGIGLAPVGLAVVRQETSSSHHHHHPLHLHNSSPDPSAPNAAMTAVASSSSSFYYPQLNPSLSLNISTPLSARPGSEGQHGKARSGTARVGQKRMLTPSASFSVTAERVAEREERNNPRTGTPTSRPSSSWLRRLSSSMSTSRDSSQAPASRPGSAAVSNGSLAFSHAGSSAPFLPDRTPSALPPNKLVKRSSSLRSTNSSPFHTPGSRLPIPVLRRPATSHQRSATLHQRHPETNQGEEMSIDDPHPSARDTPLRHYFTPKSSSASWPSSRRRSSSGIPTPINRVYPDRKYTPVLVSASRMIQPASVEMDGDVDSSDNDAASRDAFAPAFTASSPLPVQPPRTEEGPTPRRSFSIGDLLSTGPQPLWRRPSQKKTKNPGSKLVRRRDRVVSAPQESMGNRVSVGGSTDNERPTKRRELTTAQLTPRSIYSSSSSNAYLEADLAHEIQLNLTPDRTTPERFEGVRAPHHTDTALTQGTPPLEQRRLPSATSLSAAARSARVSAAQSEATSLIDSDSEYRSIGDVSTDYQSETAYNSYNTRTTRSSSGRRGPHIEKIFEDSPPNFSSGRSTKLKDLLGDASFTPAAAAAATDFGGGQYRHSTIEEESSITSTPVRSLRANSVLSTPSARPGVPQIFTSSPPEMRIMPDPDEIDWDAMDDDFDAPSVAVHQQNALRLMPGPKALAFRFGPALQASDPVSALRSSPKGGAANGVRAERAANLYEWSEVQSSPGHHAEAPARPRTVHGKKDGGEGRGSRAAGRHPLSGMHARSHSVPVAPDSGGRRHDVGSNRFGTWNVGSKMVTEDWNEDFAFDETPEDGSPREQQEEEEDRDRGGRHNMFVPRSIREQQENVVAHIGLLREWGLLIEELKQLRIRAVALDMLSGPHARDWEEVDAMIELADQETEEETLEPRRSPPSSPGFDYGAFDEQTSTGQTRRRTPRTSDAVQQVDSALPAPSAERAPPSPSPTRPRKDSEAVARSVIEALQSRRSVSDANPTDSTSQPRKVPFDTSTLRHIVPYVRGLKRRVKEALRETEGLHTSPSRREPPTSRLRDDDDDNDYSEDDDDNDDDEPPFLSPFSANDASARRRLRREQAATDHYAGESASADQSNDLVQRVQNMNLP